MCGIAGAINFTGISVETRVIKQMVDTIVHRGPDAEGVFVRGPVGLGHRRLSIIDLSVDGNQPMSNEDGTIWITYNGEIYNFLSIRRQLIKKGHIFRSSTDTEVIIHAYEEWGVSCINKFNGMFAFGLWDEKKGKIWLVRDRLGLKPLFYSYTPQHFLFGSEIKTILSSGLVDKSIDYNALCYYLGLNYMPAPFTLFSEIRQLLPGHYLLIDLKGTLKDVEYWDLVFQEDEYKTEEFYYENFNALLEDSVNIRLMSDVPVGVFLSGGLDSSSIAYWMSRNMTEPVKTFSVGFKEASFNELKYAREISLAIESEHYEETISGDITDLLPRIVWHSEEPTADSSMVGVYQLAQLACKHVKVVLGGDGADEILAGYETYQAYYFQKVFNLLPKSVRNLVVIPLIEKLPVSNSKVSWDFKLRRFIAGSNYLPEDAHAVWRMIFSPDALSSLLAEPQGYYGLESDVVDLYRQIFRSTNAIRPLNRMLYVDSRFYLPNDMLVKVDRMTMAHGLETREPFLDYRLVEFMASVPPRLKLKNLTVKKYLLKKSMRNRIPQDIINRKKAGFNMPKGSWFKSELKTFVMDQLATENINKIGLFNTGYIQALLRNHFSGKEDNSHQIWSILTLVIWWQQFIDGNSN